MNQNVNEEDEVNYQVVIDIPPSLIRFHKDKLEWDQHRDYNLINQDDRRVDQVYSTKCREKACGGDLSLNIAFDLRLLILQDRLKLCLVICEARWYHLIDKKWLLVRLLKTLKRKVVGFSVIGVDKLGLRFVNGQWICLGL